MRPHDQHRNLRGEIIPFAQLDDDERALVRTLLAEAASGIDWNGYSNFWMSRVDTFYSPRGLSRLEIRRTAAYRIGQDMGSRIGIREGAVRAPDYRDELSEIIRTRFGTQREFCEKSGLSEDMLSHVLSKRKHLAINTLVEALGRVGYTLHIAPLGERSDRIEESVA